MNKGIFGRGVAFDCTIFEEWDREAASQIETETETETQDDEEIDLDEKLADLQLKLLMK